MKKILISLVYFIIYNFVGFESFAQINYSPTTIHLPNDITLGQTQTLPNIRRIEQHEQNTLMNVEEYDNKGNVIFDYYKQYVGDFWNGKYIVMIKAQLFNNDNKLIKSYDIHSNAYLSIKHYLYDNVGNNTEVWVQDINDDTAEVNSNPYRFIFNLKDFKAVSEHPIMKEVEADSKKYLLWKNSFDTNSNLTKQVEFRPDGKIAAIEIYKYGTDNSLLSFYASSPGSGLSDSETIYTYKYNPTRTKKKLPQDNKLLQISKLNISPKDSLKTISEVYFYTYDQAGNIISESRYSDGSLVEKSEFAYNETDKVKAITTYLEGDKQPRIHTSFTYNKEGHITLDERKDLRNKETTINKYSYQYQYHK